MSFDHDMAMKVKDEIITDLENQIKEANESKGILKKGYEKIRDEILDLRDLKYQLEQRLQEAEEVVRFYDCHKSNNTAKAWKDSEDVHSYLGEIPCDDFEILQEGSDSCNSFLGKRARAYLAKHEAKQEGK